MSVLLVEDDPSIAIVITAALEQEGFTVTHCETLERRDQLLGEREFSALVTDVMLPDGDGIESLAVIGQEHPAMPVVIVSAQNTLDTAVRASDTGAFEYFPKPFDIDELVRTVRQAVGKRGLDNETPVEDQFGDGMPLVGRSQAMQAVFRMISRVLRNDLTVLILGESGTGKELVAEAIHELGDRRTGPFVAVNTAAIPAELIESELFGHEKGAFTGAVSRHIGKFEQAAGGTLFLDEIGDMPMQAQTRLLRALQSGTIRRVGGREEVRLDARIIAATNKDLKPQIAAGLFREDLFYRLNVVPITMPPLRERPEDIEALTRHFLNLAAREGLPRRTLGEDAAELLSRQPWRGNVRELRNFVYRLALLARDNQIDAAAVNDLFEAEPGDNTSHPDREIDLDSAVRSWLDANRPEPGNIHAQAVAAVERPLFAAILAQTGGNQIRAASLLGINRNTLRKRLNDLELDPDAFAGRH
ncbi:MAG: sigma-54-dependent Fis family transcriptional regulator [Novosphingobium sp.]|nr:sigma-54-dependent Fis family transcriptional regulator [Novosphingobium sp.]